MAVNKTIKNTAYCSSSDIMAIYNVNQYVEEVKKIVGKNNYTYTKLPKNLKLLSLHKKALHRGYIIKVEKGCSYKSNVWRVVQ